MKRQAVSQIDRSGGLPDAAFLIADCYNFGCHCVSPLKVLLIFGYA
jgi:hypothetical protein